MGRFYHGAAVMMWPDASAEVVSRLDGEDLTVVFDHRPPDVDPGRHGAVGVAFASRRGRNAADDEIVDMLAGDPEPAGARVVTSDRRLAERVRELGAGVEPSSRFRRRIDQVLATDPYR